MFAIAFDLSIEQTARAHPKGVRQAYDDIERASNRFDFVRVQGSVYLGRDEDLSRLFRAVGALKALAWFPDSVRDIRAFRVEQWSDFTGFVKDIA